MRNMLSILVGVGCLYASMAQAAFMVDGLPPEEGYHQEPAYEKGRSGHSTQDITIYEDDTYYDRMAVEYRPYITILTNDTKYKFDKLRNRSVGTDGILASVRQLNQNAHTLSIKAGKLMRYWSYEGELYIGKSFTYTASPVLESSGNYRFTAKTSLTGVFANVIYDFFEFYRVRPFFGVGIGAVQQKIDIRLSDGQSGNRSYSQTKPALQGFLGLKAQITPEFGVELGGRMMDLGSFNMRGPNLSANRPILKADTLEVEAYYFGITYRL